MSLFKCKMCGGSLDVQEGQTVIECEYCGTKQTLPKLDDDKRSREVAVHDKADVFLFAAHKAAPDVVCGIDEKYRP